MFPERLRELRKKRKLTAREFGAKFGLAESTISGYETGARTPDLATVEKFADFFQVSVDYILGRTDDPTPPEKKPVIDPDLEQDIADFTPEEIEFLNRLKKEVAFKNYLEAPEEAKKRLIEAVKLLMRGMKNPENN
ncbi:MAG TPA: helix-turn-helix domain-containing protein [Alicyclobacillus sp.]|nr:helix-turn-helix domain-containing protein [Alicyclobacillus sp.]